MGYNRILPRVGASGGSFQDRANQFSSNAIGARSAMQRGSRTETEGPGKTVGGGIGAATGMGMSGYMMAGMAKGGLTGPQGAMIGAGLGLAAYFLS